MRNNPEKYLTKNQVKKLSDYLISVLNGSFDGGSYRYLIYTVLGFRPYHYPAGMEMGLLDLNNSVHKVCMRKCKRRKVQY